MNIYRDNIYRTLYATDASAYREVPYGVCFPKNVGDIVEIIGKASENRLSVIPRCAGTSLAGQVVGSGVVADVSKYMTRIIEVNAKEHWVRLEPGVVLDELNMEVEKYGLFFAPETSTSNRCCVGGMVGNNSCGSHSLVYGSTRDHLLEAKVVLSDGSLAVFSQERAAQVLSGMNLQYIPHSLEEHIYYQLYKLAIDDTLFKKVNEEFPVKELRRRNCGYALDLVLNDIRAINNCDGLSGRPNLCSILAGSEGTLAFAYELKLNLLPLPPKEKVVVCAHCANLPNVFEANLVALKYGPMAVELMDSNVLELSKGNLAQKKNRFFVQGNPAAILIVELAKHSKQELDATAMELEKALMDSGLVYYCSKVYGKDISSVWALRKAGLGLLSGMKGDSKPVSVVEDTAVAPSRLPYYMADFAEMLKRLGLKCVYHAHIGTGELHLRPILNIKAEADRKLFKQVAYETALLVKKHKGSLSGEHGDGRLRGEFIPIMYGAEIYEVLRSVKRLWDPNGVFNVGKIVDTPPMDTCLRYDVGQKYAAEADGKAQVGVSTYFNFLDVKGLFCAVEQCNGAGDCRRSVKFGGVMCPAYRVNMDERFSTRARANILREVLTRGAFTNGNDNPFCSNEVYEVLDSCLSCKACKSECPSNVDITRLKAEYLQHRFDALGFGFGKGQFPWWGGVPFRSFMVAHMADIQRIGSFMVPIYNFFALWKVSSKILKGVLKFSSQRQIPSLSRKSLRELARLNYKDASANKSGLQIPLQNRRVYLFADEFTNYMEAELGLKFIKLLTALGYEVVIPKHYESGRAALSKGLLKVARRLAVKNVLALKDIVSENAPLIGIEPSCILSFRDEYPALVGKEVTVEIAKKLGANCLLFDEFIIKEIAAGRISSSAFTSKHVEIWLHGHCHQKALIGVEASAAMLRLPVNYKVNVIPTGCCGMAGSFGYEKEHYETSMAIGNQILFPAVRAVEQKRAENPLGHYIISAPGTSCRQQILDGTGVRALHPIEVLYGALQS
ncbi:MAG: FAD-linked oxidase C-terminal domain-containing protein [Bacteroidales bacterium]